MSHDAVDVKKNIYRQKNKERLEGVIEQRGSKLELRKGMGRKGVSETGPESSKSTTADFLRCGPVPQDFLIFVLDLVERGPF